ncbi:hypothetical protein ACIRPR_33435 [Streptomyces griseoflavus]|uniref:hypothetical protein n=1 Tax=Streptomyces griseoflavus TaxID=35619 RepID=UPI0037F95426
MNACTICGHGLHGDRALWTTCQHDHDRITTLLGDIEQMWPLLSDALEPTRGHAGPRVSGTANPGLPITGRILDLIGPAGIPARLYWRYADLALARRIQPATMPPGADARLRLALYGIRKHLSWAVQGCDLTELVGELEKMAGDLRSVTGGTDSPTVPCPAELPDGGRCTGRMRYDRDRSTAHCRTCRTSLDPSEWLEVWVKLGQPA